MTGQRADYMHRLLQNMGFKQMSSFSSDSKDVISNLGRPLKYHHSSYEHPDGRKVSFVSEDVKGSRHGGPYHGTFKVIKVLGVLE